MKKDFRKHYGESELLDCFFNQSVAEVLKEIRASKNMSLTEAVKKNNIFTRQTLDKYELGGSKLRINALYEIAKAYDMTPKEIFEKINFKYLSNLSTYTDELQKYGDKHVD